MQNANVFYITEEEKMSILRSRMESERKQKRIQNLRDTFVQKLGAFAMLALGIIPLFIDGEFIAMTFIMVPLSILTFIYGGKGVNDYDSE